MLRWLSIGVLLAGCAGPTVDEYLASHPDDSGDVVRVWSARLPGALWPIAEHLILEVRTADMPPGLGESWEVWHQPECHDEAGSYVCRDLGTLRSGVGGGAPTLVAETRGEDARRAAAWIREHAPVWRHRDVYVAWPGPNSNTFVAGLLRECPGLAVDLPPTAIGKDWLGILHAGGTTTGTGFQVDALVVGVQVGLREGVEIHFLGTALGVAFWPPALKLPGVGRLGFPQYEGSSREVPAAAGRAGSRYRTTEAFTE